MYRWDNIEFSEFPKFLIRLPASSSPASRAQKDASPAEQKTLCRFCFPSNSEGSRGPDEQQPRGTQANSVNEMAFSEPMKALVVALRDTLTAQQRALVPQLFAEYWRGVCARLDKAFVSALAEEVLVSSAGGARVNADVHLALLPVLSSIGVTRVPQNHLGETHEAVLLLALDTHSARRLVALLEQVTGSTLPRAAPANNSNSASRGPTGGSKPLTNDPIAALASINVHRLGPDTALTILSRRIEFTELNDNQKQFD